MKISRRTLFATSAAAAAVATTGCSVTGASSNAGASGSGTGEVNILLMKQAGWSESDWAGIIKGFQEANSQIKVNSTFVTYEALHDKIVTAASAGTYDVVLMDVIWPPEFAEKKIVADLTAKVPQAWKEQMQGGALDSGLYNSKFYGVPLFPSTKLFYYNKEMMAAVGASVSDIASWDGVLKVAEAIKAKGLSANPIAWSWSQAEALICDFAQLLGAFGGSFTDSAGKLDFNNAAGLQTLKFMCDSLKSGVSNPGSTTFLEDDVAKTMQQGQTAFCLNWESTFRDLNDASASNVAHKVSVMQTPAGPTGKRPGVNGAMALAVTASSKNQEAAWKLIEYATSEKVQDPLAMSQMPNWKASYDNPDVVKVNPEVFAACKDAYATSIMRPQVVNYSKVSTLLQVEIQNALLGKKSPKDALDSAVKQGNESLNN